MESRDFGAVLKEVQALFSVGTVAALSDDYLLDSFLGPRQDAAQVAFEALVRRHGPMVLRVCRGELRDEHAAEDALQATFLVLARRAGAIRDRGSVASWLFGVARRVAQRARVERARRAVHERQSAIIAASHARQSDDGPPDLMPEIQEEVDKLPEKYRAPIVLCYLEGLTHEEAASQLRLPVGTVKIRLSRARERLRGRLVRRGLAPIVLAATVTGKAAGAIATPLVNLTVKAAMQFAAGRSVAVSAAISSLVNGVIRAMFLSKVKAAAALLATSLTAVASLLAVAYLARPARSDQPPTAVQAPAKAPAQKVAATKTGDAPKEVAVETLKKSEFNRETTQRGFVQAARSAEIYSRVSGYLKSVSVDIGDSVKRGQALAVISDAELDVAVRKGQALVRRAEAVVKKAHSLCLVARSAVEAQKIKVAESMAGLERSEAAVRTKQKECDRVKDLFKRNAVDSGLVDQARFRVAAAETERASSKAQVAEARARLDEAQAKVEAAEADVLEAEADVLIARAEVEHAESRLYLTKIQSPLDGIVTRRGFHEGEFVRSGTEAGAGPLFSVVGDQKMKVVVNVPDKDARFLDKGDPVTIALLGDVFSTGTREYAGKIARTAFAENPADQTLRAEIDLDINDGGMRPGQVWGVTIVLDGRNQVLSVPIAALKFKMAGEAECHRIVDGRAVQTRIKHGEANGNRVEVLDGLNDGDTVVANYWTVSDGELVKAKSQAKNNENGGQPLR